MNYSTLVPQTPHSYFAASTLDELLQRDAQRKNDGFFPRINVTKVLAPGTGFDIVLIPTTVEEKFYHDTRPLHPMSGQEQTGSGEGEEGEMIGYEPAEGESGQGSGKKEGSQAGAGEGEHGLGNDPYEIGKVITKKLRLPNLRHKGKQFLADRQFELTDRNRGSGQLVDQRRTLDNLIRTNMLLGIIPPDTTDFTTIPFDNLLVSPNDIEYRILSVEPTYESRALVFFARDYSASMQGLPAEQVVKQQILIYSWLVYQYQRKVETRFFLHSEVSKEVPDFRTYFRLLTEGGTRIESVFSHINAVVEAENLARDYNIYIFYGGDGDDLGEAFSKRAVEEIEKALSYVNRLGITIVNDQERSFSAVLSQSGILAKKPNLIRYDLISRDADQDRLIKGINKLVSEIGVKK